MGTKPLLKQEAMPLAPVVGEALWDAEVMVRMVLWIWTRVNLVREKAQGLLTQWSRVESGSPSVAAVKAD